MLVQVFDPNELGQDRVMVVTDMHLHAHPQCDRAGHAGVSSRLWWGAEMVRQVRKLSIDHRVKAVYNLGDVTHTGKTAVRSVVADVALSALRTLHSPDVAPSHLILTGNHDQPGSERTALRALEGWPGVELVTAAHLSMAPSGRPVVAVPYDRNYERLAQTVKAAMVPGCMLLLHAGVSGASVGPERDYFPSDEELPLSTFLGAAGEFVPGAVLCGHYHAHQILHGGMVMYPGAPMHHDFGDEGSIGSVCIVDTASLKFVRFRIAAPEFCTVTLDTAASINAVVKAAQASPVPMYVRAKVQAGSKLTIARVADALMAEQKILAFQTVDERPVAAAGQTTATGSVSRLQGATTDAERVATYMKDRPPAFTADPGQLTVIADRALAYLSKARSST